MKPRAWRGGPPVSARTSPRGAADYEYATRSRSKAHLEPGDWCNSCGATVDALRMHASDCPDVGDEQRR